MFSVLTVLMFFGPLGVVAVGSRTEPRDLYITPLGSSNKCEAFFSFAFFHSDVVVFFSCTFSDPCNLERAIQLFGEGFVGMDKILFEQGGLLVCERCLSVLTSCSLCLVQKHLLSTAGARCLIFKASQWPLLTNT